MPGDDVAPEVAHAVEAAILFLAGVMFCAVPLFFLGRRIAQKYRLTQGWVLLVGTFAGAGLMVLLLWLLKEPGQLFAASSAPAFFYGVWYGGRENELKTKQKRSGGRRGSRSKQNAWGRQIPVRKTTRRK